MRANIVAVVSSTNPASESRRETNSIGEPMTPPDDELRRWCNDIIAVGGAGVHHVAACEVARALLSRLTQPQAGWRPMLTQRQRQLVQYTIQQLRDLGEPDNIEQAATFELLLGQAAPVKEGG